LAAFTAPGEGERRKGELPYKVLKLREKSNSRFSRTFSPLWMIGGLRQPKIEKKTALSAVQALDFWLLYTYRGPVQGTFPVVGPKAPAFLFWL
jgi:hypothetical protein